MEEDLSARLRRLITELREFGGMSAAEIGRQIGSTTATVTRVANGGTGMSYEYGMKIEKIHADHVEEIQQKKIEKARALMADLGSGAR